MDNINTKKKFFKFKSKLKRKDNTKNRFNPSRDWKIAITSFFALLVIVFGVNYYLHRINIAPISLDSEYNIYINSSDIDNIKTIIKEYNSKKEALLYYRDNPPQIIDPS